jgi:hypothetical protein
MRTIDYSSVQIIHGRTYNFSYFQRKKCNCTTSNTLKNVESILVNTLSIDRYSRSRSTDLFDHFLLL